MPFNPPPTYRLRRAQPRDLGALVRLEAHFPGDRLQRANLRHLLRRGHADVFVVEYAEALVADAVVLYRRGSRHARLYSLVVEPEHRGCGLADALLAVTEAGARARGVESMRLEVRPDNRAAQALYARHRYAVCGEIAEFYEDGTAALKFEKPFTAAPEPEARLAAPPPKATKFPAAQT